MGYSNEDSFQHYLGSYSNIDGQAIMLGRDTSNRDLTTVHSMAANVCTGIEEIGSDPDKDDDTHPEASIVRAIPRPPPSS
jgi:hypothetical protein